MECECSPLSCSKICGGRVSSNRPVKKCVIQGSERWLLELPSQSLAQEMETVNVVKESKHIFLSEGETSAFRALTLQPLKFQAPSFCVK